MYATIGKINQSDFRAYGPAKKADCQEWINNTLGQIVSCAQYPILAKSARIVSDKEGEQLLRLRKKFQGNNH